MPESPLAILERWEQHGAIWRTKSTDAGGAVVELLTCHGELVEELRSADPALLDYLAERPSSDLIIDIQRDYFPGGAYPLVEPEAAAGRRAGCSSASAPPASRSSTCSTSGTRPTRRSCGPAPRASRSIRWSRPPRASPSSRRPHPNGVRRHARSRSELRDAGSTSSWSAG